jgi:hypothetical protein
MCAVSATTPGAARGRRRVLPALLLALAALTPTIAHSYSLQQLLDMPLDRLLELRIGARR